MSYCRWSSDNFGCDVYVYEDVSGGFTCHVASRKITNLDEAPEQNVELFGLSEKEFNENLEPWLKNHRAFNEWLEQKAIREDIGLEFDGKSFNVDTATDMANQLEMLRDMGYKVPQYAIDSLYEEGKENGEQVEL